MHRRRSRDLSQNFVAKTHSPQTYFKVVRLTRCTFERYVRYKSEQAERSTKTVYQHATGVAECSIIREQDRSSGVEESNGLTFGLGTNRTPIHLDGTSA